MKIECVIKRMQLMLWKHFSRFALNGASDEALVAQVRALESRIPILYAVLAVNTIVLAATHVGAAPLTLTVVWPASIVFAMLLRAIYWVRISDRFPTVEQARRTLPKITVLGSLIAVSTLLWAGLLFSHDLGDTPAQLNRQWQTIFYVGFTSISCISLLMHVRATSIWIALLVSVPFCLFLGWQGSPFRWAVAVNMFLVVTAMLYVVVVFSRDFCKLIDSRTELEALHKQQSKLANTDSLTGLDNRRRFYAALECSAAANQPFAVMMIDLDGFKQVNDVHGHSVGDAVLREIGQRIGSGSNGAASTARMGGDEFAILLNGSFTPHDLLSKGQFVIESCTAPIHLPNLFIVVGASIGINRVQGGGSEPATKHVERADYALFQAKQNGKGHAELFTPEHEDRSRRAGLIEQAVRSSGFANELSVLYQPIYLAQPQMLNGFEALVRWKSSTLGNVSPSEFIPIAERSEIIHIVTRTVLSLALREAASWPAHVRLKINLSARDLASSEQMLSLLSILGSSRFDAKRLTFEITETALLDKPKQLVAAVSLIKATGASIAIDDFGTGYSSLSCIHAFEPDLIKIDRSFTLRLGQQDGGEAMIKTIIEMCRNLNARSLAEGVETKEQVDALTALGCDELQGYYFSRPVGAVQAHALAYPEPNVLRMVKR